MGLFWELKKIVHIKPLASHIIKVQKKVYLFLNIIISCAFLMGKSSLALKLDGLEASKCNGGEDQMVVKERDQIRMRLTAKVRESEARAGGTAMSPTGVRLAGRSSEPDILSWS